MTALLLYEPLPLRTTRQLGDFAEDAALAHVYGDLTAARFPLRRVSATRGHAADHPMEITAAYVDGVETASYEATIEADDTGHVCTFVDFLAPVPAGELMSAAGRGKRNATTGGLITNPGDIMADVAAIAGRSDTFQGLREECAAAGIQLAGRVDAVQSVRAWLDVIAMSAGAIWAPGMSRRYPVPTVAGGVIELDKQTAANVRVSATVDDTADVLRIAYDWCDATAKPQKYVELTASPQRHGGVIKELSLPWLRTPANAVAVGTPILQRLAGERYQVALDSSRTDIRPGRWVRLVAHPEWPFTGDDPDIMTLTVSVNQATKTVELAGEATLTTPTITVTAHSLALDEGTEGALEVSVRNGIATFTVYDENRRGLQGARVSLDGSAPKTTDDRGQVSFPYTPGSHEIAIEAPGMIAQTLTVTL